MRDKKPPEEPPHYYTVNQSYLEMGRVLHEVYNQPVLNPDNITDVSLLTANAEYMGNLARYISQVNYEVFIEKQARGMI